MTSPAVQAQRDAIALNKQMRAAAEAYAAGKHVAVQAEEAGVDVQTVCAWQRRAEFFHLVDHAKEQAASAKGEQT